MIKFKYKYGLEETHNEETKRSKMNQLNINIRVIFEHADDIIIEEERESVQHQNIFKQLKIDHEIQNFTLNSKQLQKKIKIENIKIIQMEPDQKRVKLFLPNEAEYLRKMPTMEDNSRVFIKSEGVVSFGEDVHFIDIILISNQGYFFEKRTLVNNYAELYDGIRRMVPDTSEIPEKARKLLNDIGISNPKIKHVGNYKIKNNYRGTLIIEYNYVFEIKLPKEFAKFMYPQRTDNTWIHYPTEEAILMKISGPVKYHMRKQDPTLVFPRVIIFDAPDGTGKTTMLGYLKRQLLRDGLRFTHNEFSYNKRKDESMLTFRLNVAKTRNRRILSYNATDDIIIIDKCPYVEYPYQRTNWERNDRLNKQEEKCLFEEVFRLRHVIDNATIVLLENPDAWNNYSAREITFAGKTNFPTMAKHTYDEMKSNFEKCAVELYKSYFTKKIKNDDQSWEDIYNGLKHCGYLKPRKFTWTNVEEEIPSIKEEKDNNLI